MFRVVQSGYATFGEGETRDEAIADAAKWMKDDNGQPMTPEQVDELLVNEHVHFHGQFICVDESSQHFDTQA